MSELALREGWFGYLCEKVEAPVEYIALLRELHSIEFYYTNPMDENRELDGKRLRESYFSEKELAEFEDTPCSVLEMMVALVIRADDELAYDLDKGSQAMPLFWEMVSNSGLDRFSTPLDENGITEKNWDPLEIHILVLKVLNRTFTADGKGSFFPIEGYTGDLREVEIWRQIGSYLTNKLTNSLDFGAI